MAPTTANANWTGRCRWRWVFRCGSVRPSWNCADHAADNADAHRADDAVLTLRYAVRSDRGLVRTNNEDSVYAGPRLLAIADGMGGHAAGEVASQLVIAALAHLDDDEPGGDLLAKLDQAVREG